MWRWAPAMGYFSAILSGAALGFVLFCLLGSARVRAKGFLHVDSSNVGLVGAGPDGHGSWRGPDPGSARVTRVVRRLSHFPRLRGKLSEKVARKFYLCRLSIEIAACGGVFRFRRQLNWPARTPSAARSPEGRRSRVATVLDALAKRGEKRWPAAELKRRGFGVTEAAHLAREGARLLGKALRIATVDRLRVVAVFGLGDAAATGIFVGSLWASLFSVPAVSRELLQATRAQRRPGALPRVFVRVSPDFLQERASVALDIVARVRPIQLPALLRDLRRLKRIWQEDIPRRRIRWICWRDKSKPGEAIIRAGGKGRCPRLASRR